MQKRKESVSIESYIYYLFISKYNSRERKKKEKMEEEKKKD